jgi:hypothetical protein
MSFPRGTLVTEEFVTKWERCCTVPDDRYNRHIHLDGELSQEDVAELMAWKAGCRFAKRARNWAKAVPIELINRTRRTPEFTDEELQGYFDLVRHHLRHENLARSGGIIWPIFLCHVSQPGCVPIYDVNVWRAWGAITDGIAWQNLRLRPTTLETYLDYRFWFNAEIAIHELEPRRLDRALMTYGRSLRRPTTSLGVRT